jgi:ABC-type transporter MlaC component
VSYGDGRPSRQLRWRVSARNGRYKVSDVSVAGFWLTLQLRSEFVSFLRKNNGNFEALFAALRRSSR